MFLHLLILSVFIVAIIMLPLGIKLLSDPNAKYTVHSCSLENGDTNVDGSCSKCQIKELADCPEKKK